MQAGINPWINPEAGNLVMAKAGMALLLSCLFLWVYFRLNKEKLFLYLGATLGIHGIVFALLFSSEQPIIISVFIEIAIITVFIAILNSFLILLLHKMNKKFVIIHDGVYINQADGTIKYKFYFIASGITMLILGFIFKTPCDYMKSMVRGFALWFFLALILFLSAYISSRILPMKSESDVAILGEETPRVHLVDIFQVSESISSLEIILVPVMILTLWGLLIFATKKSATAQDFGGMAILVVLALSIVFQEIRKKKRKEY